MPRGVYTPLLRQPPAALFPPLFGCAPRGFFFSPRPPARRCKILPSPLGRVGARGKEPRGLPPRRGSFVGGPGSLPPDRAPQLVPGEVGRPGIPAAPFTVGGDRCPVATGSLGRAVRAITCGPPLLGRRPGAWSNILPVARDIQPNFPRGRDQLKETFILRRSPTSLKTPVAHHPGAYARDRFQAPRRAPAPIPGLLWKEECLLPPFRSEGRTRDPRLGRRPWVGTGPWPPIALPAQGRGGLSSASKGYPADCWTLPGHPPRPGFGTFRRPQRGKPPLFRPGSCPEISPIIRGDPRRLEQVLDNLISTPSSIPAWGRSLRVRSASESSSLRDDGWASRWRSRTTSSQRFYRVEGRRPAVAGTGLAST